MPTGGGPGAHDAFVPRDLDDVRERVVMPVVHSLVRPDELESVDVGWGWRLPDRYREWDSREPHDYERDLFVLVAAMGKTLEWQIWIPGQNAPADTLDEVAYNFALRLEQWAEDVLGHPQPQVARYQIPLRAH
jgi:hypothetical protein